MQRIAFILLLALVGTAAACSHSVSKPVVFPTTAPDDWGRIKWGSVVNGLQLGIVYKNEWYFKGQSPDLIIDVYFRNCGDLVIYLLRPEAEASKPNEPRNPDIGIRFTGVDGSVWTGPAFSPPRQSKPSLMTIKPGEIYRESGGITIPGPRYEGWPAHLVVKGDYGGWRPLNSKAPEGAIRFVYRNDEHVRECFNPGLAARGETVIHWNLQQRRANLLIVRSRRIFAWLSANANPFSSRCLSRQPI